MVILQSFITSRLKGILYSMHSSAQIHQCSRKHKYDTTRSQLSDHHQFYSSRHEPFRIHFGPGDLYNDRNQSPKKVTQFHHGTYNPPASFESHPLCSSRMDRIARPLDRVALLQSMRRVVNQHAKTALKQNEIIHTRTKSVLSSTAVTETPVSWPPADRTSV